LVKEVTKERAVPKQTNLIHLGKKYSHFFIYACALTWLIYTYHRYLPLLTRPRFKEIFSTIETAVTRAGLVDIFVVAWLWVAAYLLGRKFLRLLKVPLEPGMERLALSSAAGLSLVSLTVLVLSLLNMLHRPLSWVLLIVITALGAQELKTAWREAWGGVTQRLGRAQFSATWLGHAFILAFLLVVLGLILISALGPPIEYDELAYHLTGPKVYVQQHGLKPIPTIPHTFFPKNIGMLFTLGMLLHNEVTAKLIHYLLGLLSLFIVYAFGSTYFSRSVGWVAAGVLATSPIFLWEMRTALIDVGYAFYVFASLYAGVIWLRSGERSWYRLTIYFTAFCLGIKYHAVFALASLAALIFLYRLISQRDLKLAATTTLKVGLLSALGFLPWGAIALVQTRNPFYPLLNNIFQSPYWTVEHTLMTVSNLAGTGGVKLTSASWWDFLIVPWRMVVDSGHFSGNIGPFFLLLIPFLVLKRNVEPKIKLVLAFSLFYSLTWMFTGGHGRYYVPVLPGLAVVGAYGLVKWLESGQNLSHRYLARATATVLILMACFNTPFFENYGASSGYGFSIMHTLPLRYLLGEESRETYLSRCVRNYPVIQYLNQLPGKKKTLFWWNDDQQSMFYVDGVAAGHFSPFGTKLFREDSEELYRILRENAVTHLIVAQPMQEANLLTRPEGDFVRRYLKKVYQKNATILYEVSPAPMTQPIIFYDFLNHVREAAIRMPNEPPGKPNTDYRMVTGIGTDARYSLLGFPPSEVEYSLTLCERPLLQFAVGQAIPSCSGRGSFQIWLSRVTGERQQIYSRELHAEQNPQDVGWFEERLELGAFAGQQVKILFETKHLGGGSCVWYCWADPVILSQPADR
jgi:hypothetical protein